MLDFNTIKRELPLGSINKKPGLRPELEYDDELYEYLDRK